VLLTLSGRRRGGEQLAGKSVTSLSIITVRSRISYVCQ
jgi:hypothetical protein